MGLAWSTWLDMKVLLRIDIPPGVLNERIIANALNDKR